MTDFAALVSRTDGAELRMPVDACVASLMVKDAQVADQVAQLNEARAEYAQTIARRLQELVPLRAALFGDLWLRAVGADGRTFSEVFGRICDGASLEAWTVNRGFLVASLWWPVGTEFEQVVVAFPPNWLGAGAEAVMRCDAKRMTSDHLLALALSQNLAIQGALKQVLPWSEVDAYALKLRAARAGAHPTS